MNFVTSLAKKRTEYHIALSHQRLNNDSVRFVQSYIYAETHHAWRVVLDATKLRREQWAMHQAQLLVNQHITMLLKCRHEGAEKFSRAWDYLRLQHVSHDHIAATPVLWVNNDTFIDPTYIEIGNTSVSTNIISGLERPESATTLKLFLTAWFRLQRHYEIHDITPQLIWDEIEIIKDCRRRFAQRRADEKDRQFLKDARTIPKKTLSHFQSSKQPEAVWKLLHVYAKRPRSRFYRAVLDSDTRQSIARAVATNKCGRAAHDVARQLDYHLRLIPNSAYDYPSIRSDIIALIKQKQYPNSKLEKILASILPLKIESYDCYIRFLHDLNGVISMLVRLPSNRFESDLLNAFQQRNTHNIKMHLSVILQADSKVQTSVIKSHSNSIRASADAILMISHRSHHAKITIAASPYATIHSERMAQNAIRLGCHKKLHELLDGVGQTTVQQTTPSSIIGSLEKWGMSIEYTNMSIPDGWLAMALPSICIPFGCGQHIAQFGYDGGYLAVYDNKNLCLGGYIVDVGDYYLLNNLQGSLSNRNNKSNCRIAIANTIGKVLSRLGRSVVMRDFSFNALSLPVALRLKAKALHLNLPPIRLDSSSDGEFFILPARPEP